VCATSRARLRGGFVITQVPVFLAGADDLLVVVVLHVEVHNLMVPAWVDCSVAKT